MRMESVRNPADQKESSVMRFGTQATIFHDNMLKEKNEQINIKRSATDVLYLRL